ncbi:hypothetical protein, partial [Streptomyces sp. PU_AKi4]|uniref:hypothetical protein n=1 Tax=Streptomyces sp. PU_AKi4 TaxID=2800809 RepID=UPI003523F5F7
RATRPDRSIGPSVPPAGQAVGPTTPPPRPGHAARPSRRPERAVGLFVLRRPVYAASRCSLAGSQGWGSGARGGVEIAAAAAQDASRSCIGIPETGCGRDCAVVRRALWWAGMDAS